MSDDYVFKTGAGGLMTPIRGVLTKQGKFKPFVGPASYWPRPDPNAPKLVVTAIDRDAGTITFGGK